MRMLTRRVRDVLLSRNFIWCYAVLLAIGSSVSLPAEYGIVSFLLEGLLVGMPFACMLAAWGRAFGRSAAWRNRARRAACHGRCRGVRVFAAAGLLGAAVGFSRCQPASVCQRLGACRRGAFVRDAAASHGSDAAAKDAQSQAGAGFSFGQLLATKRSAPKPPAFRARSLPARRCSDCRAA